MRVYLAGRFSRKAELRGYAYDLSRVGIEVDARWLQNGFHEESASPGVEQRFAVEDLEDVKRADVFVIFTEAEGTYTRGGRFVEMGYALALGKPVIVIGRKENIFVRLAEKQVATWQQAVHELLARKREMERRNDHAE